MIKTCEDCGKDIGVSGTICSDCYTARKMKNAKSSMSIWSGPYQSAYSKNEYQEAKDEYDENAQNKKNAEKKAKKLAESFWK